ncbi:MAG TPA: hypothetical protein P5534_17490, partial [Candidatus Paceibacterota bacterium]|nr:hypothetical protein [Candidatus Paceibacterota bacterium]
STAKSNLTSGPNSGVHFTPQVSTFHNRFQGRKPCSPMMAKTTPTPKQTPALELETPTMKNNTTAGAMMNNNQYETRANR